MYSELQRLSSVSASVGLGHWSEYLYHTYDIVATMHCGHSSTSLVIVPNRTHPPPLKAEEFLPRV